MINKYSSVPLYNQLIDILMQMIGNGEYKPGDKIPSEQDLCEIYDISRPTVRQAIKELVQKGILIKLKGKGTFVVENEKKNKIGNLTGFEYSILDSDDLYEKNIISISEKEINDVKISELFNSTTNKFCEVCFEMKSNETIYGTACSIVNLQHFPNLAADLENKKPSYEILKAKYPYLPVRSRNSISMDYASSKDSDEFNIPQGKALFCHTSVLYSRSGFVVEVISCRYNAAITELGFESSK